MPRKNKNKPKGLGKEIKGKDEDELVNDFIEFRGKHISLMRFAYDIFRYSAMKFHVPEKSISVWTNAENDYGYPDFCSSVGNSMIEVQIVLRFELHERIQEHRRQSKLESLEKICDVFHEVMKTIENSFTEDVVTDAIISLVIVCELIIFLYSIGSHLHVQDLAKYWFTSYFRSKKKSFESRGVLAAIYDEGDLVIKDSSFHDKFISKFCIPYRNSVSNADLGRIFHRQRKEHLYNILASNLSEDGQPKKHVMLYTPSTVHDRTPPHLVAVPALPSKHDEASGLDTSMNPRIVTLQHENIPRTPNGPGAETPSKNLLGPSSQKPVGSLKEESNQNVRLNREETFSSLEQNLGQLRLEEKASGLTVVNDPAPSQSFACARPKEPTKQRGGSSGNKKSPGAETPSKNRLGPSSQKPVGSLKEPSNQNVRLNREETFSSLEQNLGQLRLEEKASGLTVVNDPALSQSFACARPKEPTKQRGESSGNKKGPGAETPSKNLLGPSSQKPVRSLKEPSNQNVRLNREETFSSLEQNLGQLRLEEKASGLIVVNDPAPSQSFAGARPKEPTKQRGGSSGNKKSGSKSHENFEGRNFESPRVDRLMNPGLGIPPHEDLLRSLIGRPVVETPSQDPLGASPQNSSRRRKEKSRKRVM